MPAILWTTHAGRRDRARRSPTCSSATSTRPAGSPRPGTARTDGLPDILDYDIINGRPDLPVLPGRRRSTRSGTACRYTSFRYGTLRAGRHRADGTVTVSVDVTNTGSRAGDEVVQLYTHQRTSRVEQPVKQLRAFQRVHLAPGQTKTVTLRARRRRPGASGTSPADRWVVEARPTTCSSARRRRTSAPARQLRVRGETIPPRPAAHHPGGELRRLPGDRAAGRGEGGRHVGRGDRRRAVGPLHGRGPARPGGSSPAGSPTRARRRTVQVRLDDPVRGPLLAHARGAVNRRRVRVRHRQRRPRQGVGAARRVPGVRRAGAARHVHGLVVALFRV